jgi:hypothetical protein
MRRHSRALRCVARWVWADTETAGRLLMEEAGVAWQRAVATET